MVALISGLRGLTSSALYEPVGRSGFGCPVSLLLEKICSTAIAYPRDVVAGEPGRTAGSTLVARIEIESSLLRMISKVRNCWGKSRNDDSISIQIGRADV